jgi:hypothetical protein
MISNIASAYPGLFNYHTLINMDYREFMLWHNMACDKLACDIYADAMTNNLSMSTIDGWKGAIESATNLKIKGSVKDERKDNMPDTKEGWASKEDYKRHMQLIKFQTSSIR